MMEFTFRRIEREITDDLVQDIYAAMSAMVEAWDYTEPEAAGAVRDVMGGDPVVTEALRKALAEDGRTLARDIDDIMATLTGAVPQDA